jgi:RHS repeat-associated protein
MCLFRQGILYTCFFITLSVFSQDARERKELNIFNDYDFQPEVYSFPKPVHAGVGSGGELNLSLPILTVKGRAGFDFPIAFSYQSGIKVEAEASWLGLGWNFNAGSITRDVRGAMRGSGCDFADVPDMMPDYYYVTLPGYGSFEMFRENIFRDTKYLRIPQDRQTGSFQLKSHKPVRITFRTIAQMLADPDILSTHDIERLHEIRARLQPNGGNATDDIGEFTVSTPDGRRYIFRLPTIAEWTPPYNISGGVFHVNAWRLVAILSPDCDYSGTLNPFALNATRGNWIVFDYQFIPSTPSDRREYYYVERITTAHHQARFVTSQRNDWTRTMEIWSTETDYKKNFRKLDAINYYVRASGSLWKWRLIKKISLENDYSLAPNTISNKRGKLTLKAITFSNAAGAAFHPGYHFSYAYNPTITLKRPRYDAFGYYSSGYPWQRGDRKDKNMPTHYEAAAWSLTEIENPLGGQERIFYECNEFVDDFFHMYFIYKPNPRDNKEIYIPLCGSKQYGIADIRRSGGPRVVCIKRETTDTNLQRETYFSYANGRLQCLPEKLIPYLETFPTRRGEFYRRSRGRDGVTYGSISETVMDMASMTSRQIERFYLVTGGGTGISRLTQKKSTNILYYQDHVTAIYLNTDLSDIWGKLYREVSTEHDAYNSSYTSEKNLVFSVADVIMASDVRLRHGAFNLQTAITQTGMRILEEHSWEAYNQGDRKKKLKTFTYHNKSLQLLKEETHVDNQISVKHLRYAWQDYNGSDNPVDNNQLQLLSKIWTEVFTNTTSSSGKVAGATIFTYQLQRNNKSAAEGAYIFVNDRQYKLHLDDYPISLPAFTAWAKHSQQKGWKLTTTTAFNQYNLPTLITLPGNAKYLIDYGDNNAALANSYVHEVTYLCEDKSLSRSVVYDPIWHLAEEITDENARKVRFSYDEFGRLHERFDASDRLLARFGYAFSRNLAKKGNYDPAQPNRTFQTTFFDDDRQLTGTKYFGAWGEKLQSALGYKHQFRRLHTVYDSFGRLLERGSPYRYATSNYDGFAHRRRPDASLLPEFTLQTKEQHLLAGAFSRYESQLWPDSNHVRISAHDIIGSDKKLSLNLRSSFFLQHGEVNLRLDYGDGRRFSDFIRIEAEEMGQQTVVSQSRTYDIDLANAKWVDIYLLCKPYGSFVAYGEGHVSKHYIMADLNLGIANDQLKQAQYHSHNTYLGDDKRLTRVAFPAERRDEIPSRKFSYRFVRRSMLNMPEVAVEKPESEAYFISTEKAITAESKRWASMKTYTYLPPIDHECEISILLQAGSYPRNGAESQVNINSNDPEFENISLLCKKGSQKTTREIRFRKGFRYTVVCEVNALWGIGFMRAKVGLPIMEKYIAEAQHHSAPDLLLEITAQDEIGDVVKTYYNGLAQQVYEVRGAGGAIKKTMYIYDPAGNLSTVYQPNYFSPPANSDKADWILSYSYNTLGQLKQKSNGDAGTSTYIYDTRGNMIASQDAGQRLHGQFLHVAYDYANRPLASGVVKGDMIKTGQGKLHVKDMQNAYVYDGYGIMPVGRGKRLHDYGRRFRFGDARGRITQVASKYADLWQYELYHYDIHGRITHKRIITENGAGKSEISTDIYMTYDRQGKLLHRRVVCNGQALTHWYDYNTFAELSAVYIATEDKKPQLPTITYKYDVNGNLSQTRMAKGNGYITVDRAYNLRNWLTKINAHGSKKLFRSDYSYQPDGNIKDMVFFNSEFDRNENRYSYNYDATKQLKQANFATFNGRYWLSSRKYNVQNLNYDANGNILSLDRYDEDGNRSDRLRYQYDHSNRLHAVDDIGDRFAGWDAQDLLLHYDKNGSVTNIWRRQEQQQVVMRLNRLRLPEELNIYSVDKHVRLQTRARSVQGRGAFQITLAGGQYKSYRGRGLWVVQLSNDGMHITSARRFDMYNDGRSGRQGNTLASYLRSIPRDGRLLAIGVYETGNDYSCREWTESAWLELEKLGLSQIRQLRYRDSYAALVITGQSERTLEQRSKYYWYASEYFRADVSLALKPRSGVTYRYNDAGQRFQKIFGSSHTEHYIMDGSLCLGIANGQGKITYWNLIAGAVAGRYEPSSRQVLYYIKDHLGSPRMGIDQNERIITASDYYPFGLRLPARTYTGTAPQVKEGFTGKETDEESKLKYFGARLSSLSIGRWLSTDPIQSVISPYNFVSNNPICRIDPDGLKDYYIFVYPNANQSTPSAYNYIMEVYTYDTEDWSFGKYKTVEHQVNKKGIFDVIRHSTDSRYLSSPAGKYEATWGQFGKKFKYEHVWFWTEPLEEEKAVKLRDKQPINGAYHKTGVKIHWGRVSHGCIVLRRFSWNRFASIFENYDEEVDNLYVIIQDKGLPDLLKGIPHEILSSEGFNHKIKIYTRGDAENVAKRLYDTGIYDVYIGNVKYVPE